MEKFLRYVLRIVMVAFVVAAAGCAAGRLHSEGLAAIAAGHEEEGLRKLAEAHAAAPTNTQLALDHLTQRETLTNKWIDIARKKVEAGDVSGGRTYYGRVLKVDANNHLANEEITALSHLDSINEFLKEGRAALTTGDIETASSMASNVGALYQDDKNVAALIRDIHAAAEGSRARVRSHLTGMQDSIVSLHFTDASLRMIFEALGRSSGVSFIFDRDLKNDLRTSIDVEGMPAEQVIQLLLRTNQLRGKVLSDRTMLVYQNAPEKMKEYEDLVVKAFYLTSASAKQAETVLKTVLKLDDLYVDDKLNLIVIRDNPETVKLAEKVISLIDVQEPEVMLEVAVLEVQRTKLTQLGVDWPDSVSISPLGPSGKAAATIEDLDGLRPSRLGANVGSAIVNLRRELTDSNLLANPRIRVKNREKASILIGEKVPVLTTTATSTGFVSENVQYLDVGLKLNVEPIVSLRNDVEIRVGLEVSSITKQISTNSGALVYQIGTRDADTVLRLRDGETQILAGLINDEDRASANRIPILGDIPILNRIFGSKQRSKDKTEIVLSITPHVLANIERPAPAQRQFWSGTAAVLDTEPLVLETKPDASESDSSESDSGEKPAAEMATSVALSWVAPENLVVGQEADIKLKAHANGLLMALPLQLAVDPESFDIVKIEEGDYFKRGNVPTSFNSMIDKEGGKILISAARTGSTGVAGDGTLLTLKIRPKLSGSKETIQVSGAAPVAPNGEAVKVEMPPALELNARDEGN